MLFIVLSGIVGAGATFFALWPTTPSVHFWPRRFLGPRSPVVGPADCRRQATITSHDEMSERVRLE